MNVQSDRDHVQKKLDQFGEGSPERVEFGPTGNAYVGPDGTLWYEFATIELHSVNFWVTNTRAAGAPAESRKLTIAHNRAEMDDFQ